MKVHEGTCNGKGHGTVKEVIEVHFQGNLVTKSDVGIFQVVPGLTEFIKKHLTNLFALINQISFLSSPYEILDKLCKVCFAFSSCVIWAVEYWENVLYSTICGSLCMFCQNTPGRFTSINNLIWKSQRKKEELPTQILSFFFFSDNFSLKYHILHTS